MSLRDQYKSAIQQGQEENERKEREAFFPYTPRGKMKRINDGLGQIAAKIEDDLAQHIQDVATGAKSEGPLNYRIENISYMPVQDMKDVQRLEGYKALQRACAQPRVDVQVVVVMHHGSFNNGVDIRVYPDRPFKDSHLSLDGVRVRKLPQKSAPAAAKNAIAVRRPITFAAKG